MNIVATLPYKAVDFAAEIPNLRNAHWAICQIMPVIAPPARAYLNFMPGKIWADFEKYFMKGRKKAIKRAVYQMTPHVLNPRLSIQQGTFLCPSNIKFSFMANFCASLSEATSIDNHIRVLKIDQQARLKALIELYRMNISRASLFPGLSGLALMKLFLPKFTRICSRKCLRNTLLTALRN